MRRTVVDLTRFRCRLVSQSFTLLRAAISSRGVLLHVRETRAEAAHSRYGPLDVVPRQATMVVARSVQLNWNVR